MYTSIGSYSLYISHNSSLICIILSIVFPLGFITPDAIIPPSSLSNIAQPVDVVLLSIPHCSHIELPLILIIQLFCNNVKNRVR